MKKIVGHFHNGIHYLNNSKIFTGIMMILLNIGSKYITIKLSKSQEAYVRNYIMREILVFSICWMGTRDIYISIILTASFFVLTQHLFNEESSYCILPKKYRQFHMFDTNQDGEVSQQEINDAVALLTKAKQHKHNKQKETVYKYFTSNK
jgi:hypothetical protein